MKMRKLLSIGAIGLTLTCFTSIGVSAAAKPTNDQIKKDMIAMFLNNTSPIDYNATRNTVVGNVVNKDTLSNINTNDFGGKYSYLNIVLKQIDTSKTFADNAKTILTSLTDSDMNGLVTDIRNLAEQLKAIENSSDATKKLTIEKDVKTLITEKNTSLDVKFGKNYNNKITMSILKNGNVILQLDSTDAYTLSQALGNNASKLEQYLQLAQILG
jgi:hypothetical protein